MLVDLRAKGITGQEAESVLGSAHMTINKNAIPNDPEKPMVTSGVRIGTPAMTTRGFKDEEARATAELIADVLDNPRDPANLEAVRAKVIALTSRFLDRKLHEYEALKAEIECLYQDVKLAVKKDASKAS